MLLSILGFICKTIFAPIVDALVEGLSFGAFSAIINDGKLLWLD